VVQDDSTTLNWSASNADKVTITPLGSESTSGSQTIEAQPTQTNTGPVDERVSYTIEASNACGGTATQTASLHIVGSIDPPPSINLASLFYPTNYPTTRHPKIGLVESQQQALAQIAKHFKNYRQYNENARLMLVGHTDVRKSQEYNMALSERRADLVKNYLVANGIAADEIQTKAVGKEQELPVKEVDELQMKDPQKPEKGMMRSTKVTWLAYNRRVDVVLEPAGQQSIVAFPNDASDSRILWEAAEPSLKKVEMAAKAPTAEGSLHAGLSNNR
jgi:hypothetical protein